VTERKNDCLLSRYAYGRPGRRGERGLSLVEIIMVFAIIAILLSITAISLKSTVQREGPKGMANNVVADLRAARTEASRSGKLVAICFPSDGKTNPFSQNAILRKGSQTGHISKSLSYDRAYNGYLFAGTWPGAETMSWEVPIGWSTATSDEFCIFFRPDGTAFSNDIPAVEGNYPLLVGSAFVANGTGTATSVAAVSDPYTIWVSGSGNISLEENTTPSGTLPPTDIEPNPATSSVTASPDDNPPVIEDIEFLPKGVPGSDTVGIGQNYVDIHPDQKETEENRLEYGIATMLITASDKDGGPLYFDLKAIASSGARGNFTVSNETGAMDYIYDPATNSGKWQALVSWRPPPGADEDTVYELQITIRDDKGLTAFTASGAGLLPKIASLPPSRMVLQTDDEQLYLSNIEGAATVKITEDDEPEYEPFFSPDGTRIYSKHRTPGGGLQIRVRNADGSGLKVLREFSPAIVAANSTIIDGRRDIQIKFDPTYQYAAYKVNARVGHYEAYKAVQVRRTPRGRLIWELQPENGFIPEIHELEVLHLNSGTPPITVATDAFGDFYWDGEVDHTLRFQSATSHESIDQYVIPTRDQADDGIRRYIGNLGHNINTESGVTLSGFPPTTIPDHGVGVDATDQVFNLTEPDWFLDLPASGVDLRRSSSPSRHAVTGSNIVGKPSWSADGLFVTFIEDTGPGANRTITVKEVLNPDFSRKSTPETKYTFSGPNLTDAKLSPKGRWVFFIQNDKLYRAINSNGSTPVRISENLGKNIATIAVSQ
jgi:type II secretory pathway pseudopilin PulG